VLTFGKGRAAQSGLRPGRERRGGEAVAGLCWMRLFRMTCCFGGEDVSRGDGERCMCVEVRSGDSYVKQRVQRGVGRTARPGTWSCGWTEIRS
jgi:hypothetical protein